MKVCSSIGFRTVIADAEASVFIACVGLPDRTIEFSLRHDNGLIFGILVGLICTMAYHALLGNHLQLNHNMARKTWYRYVLLRQ